MSLLRPERRAFLLGALTAGGVSLASGTISAHSANRPAVAVGKRMVPLFRLLANLHGGRSGPSFEVIDAGETSIEQLNNFTRMVDGRQPADVLGVDVVHMSQLAAHLCEIDETTVDSLAPPLRTCVVSPAKGRAAACYGRPFASDVGMLFARAGLDDRLASTTLTDLLRGARAATWTAQLSGHKQVHGEGLLCAFFEHAIAVEGCAGLLSQDGVPAHDLRLWNTALKSIRTAIKLGRLRAAEDDEGALELFNDGDGVDYMRNWPTFLGYSPRGEQVALSRMVSMGTGILGGMNLAVTRDARHRRAATEITEFLAGPEAQKVVALYGFPPVRQDVYGDDGLRKAIPHLPEVMNAILTSRRRPATDRYEHFSDAVVGTLRACLSSTRDFIGADLEKWHSHLG